MSSVGPDGAILDDDGKPTGLRVKRNFAVNTPGEVAKTAADAGSNFIKRNVGPLAAQYAGGAGGAALGAALAPETGGLSVVLPLLMGAAGAGGANVAAMKGLPKEYGGDPDSSKLSDFMWGAIPEGVGRAVPAGVSRFLAKKLSKGMMERGTEFEKTAQDVAKSTREQIATGLQGPEVTAANIRQVGQALGSPTGYKMPAPKGATAITAAANQAQAHVLGPLDRQRETLGAPIGAAYDALKGKPPLSPADAQDLAEAARNVQSNLISPAPKAKAVLEKIQKFGLTGAPVEDIEHPTAEQLAALPKDQRDYFIRQFGEGGGAAQDVNLPTPDELRVLRQGLGKSLANAEGGDAHAIKELRQAIDEHLMPLLPPEIKAQHAEYHNFLQNHPWRSVNQLRKLGDPEAIGDWMFKRRPLVVNEAIRNATPEEREGYKEMLAQRVLSEVDAAAEPTANRAKLRAQLAPLRNNGTLQALYGSQKEAMYNNFVHLPERRLAAAKDFTSPKGQKLYNEGFWQEAKRRGEAGHEAAEAGFQAWYNQLPPERQAIVRQNTPTLTLPKQPPRLPSPQQSLADQLRPAPGGKFAVPKFVLASSLGGAALGSMSGYTAKYAIGFGLMSLTGSGMKALMRAGGADAVAKMYASPTGRAAGAAAFRALAQIGARTLHQNAQQPDDQDAADQ